VASVSAMAPSCTLDEAGAGVVVLRLSAGDNRFNPSVVSEVHAHLDAVERRTGPCALVIAGGDKFFSNGHDVAWLEAAAARGGTAAGSEAALYITSFYALLQRLMTLPVVTVACITGHAFAGGCLLAAACDFRVMRADRGFLCMNEIDMALAVSEAEQRASHVQPGAFEGADAAMVTVLQTKYSAMQVRDLLLGGTRFTGAAALQRGLVDEAVAGDSAVALTAAVKLAERFAPRGVPRNRRTVGVLKREMLAGASARL
jgi:enoyl-CoA hydratase/carnithine racemase